MKALITGASSGIGKDMAIYLSSLGYDLFLVARNKNKLEKIFNDYNNVNFIIMDLTDKDNCYKLYDMLKEENIDILINNAGFGDAGIFDETNLEKDINMINLNVISYHILTKLFLKDFKKRNYGRILNVASVAGFMPGPYMATYYATKNYITSLSLAIYQELKDSRSDVKISIFCPGPVNTNFNKVANVKFNLMSIDSVYAAKYAINKMFLNKVVIIPPNMKLNRILAKICPLKLVMYINSKVQYKKL